MQAYITNIAAAITGKQGFKNEVSDEDSDSLYAQSVIFIVIYLGLLLISAFGAARLSYNYNLFIGNTSGTALAFSILNFVFSCFYYPYYALFLDPLAGKRNRSNNGQGFR
jgi:uncharacterized membrane protein (DUF485 family)